ncbi:MAG: glutamate-1-semialdehyde 2,1-aminomutase [Candidatus Riflebacteria bacterium]|nr:glutamate-1-semialdehyde 2,1-aminomutase [Candidatus Riflebacteria bacterium]
MISSITNQSALDESRKYFPGGVNSPVRAFKAVGGVPPFIVSGKGPCITDVEGHHYVDYVGSWGPLILGHADKDIISAITSAAEKGTSFGAPTVAETQLAELIVKAFPAIEKMRFVSSGTEATMSAVRLARGYTNRTLILKFEGCYHGHADSLLVSAGSGVATLGIPDCPGVTPQTASCTISIPFNDFEAFDMAFKTHRGHIAAVILEPVCGNMGVVEPVEGFLKMIREKTLEDGSLLIFDEVMTGFRSCFGGVQTLACIEPDLTCLGKVVGGGLPLAVYGGKREIMNRIAPDGPVYQAGTLSGNPIAVAAGTAALKKLADNPDFYTNLLATTEKLSESLLKAGRNRGFDLTLNRSGSMFTLFFTKDQVRNFSDAKKSDTVKFAKWFRGMLSHGIYLPPSQFEAAFVSGTHKQEEIDRTIQAAEKTFDEIKAHTHS